MWEVAINILYITLESLFCTKDLEMWEPKLNKMVIKLYMIS